MELHADLRTRMVTTSVPVRAPREGRSDTRVRWILHQLRDAPDDLRVEVRFERTSKTTSALLGEVRDDAEALLLPDDHKRPPREFRLSLSRSMGTKRNNKPGSFIAETRQQAIDFYRELVQNLVEWQPQAPKMRDSAKTAGSPASDEATSDADGGDGEERRSTTQPGEWAPPPPEPTSAEADEEPSQPVAPTSDPTRPDAATDE